MFTGTELKVTFSYAIAESIKPSPRLNVASMTNAENLIDQFPSVLFARLHHNVPQEPLTGHPVFSSLVG